MSSSSSSSSSPDAESRRKKVKKSTESGIQRSLPNILITGTPGTGKSTLSKRLADSVEDMQWINIGDFAKERGFLGSYDEERDCYELEEDPLLDELEDPIAKGGVIIDYHVTDFFPERYFDIVFVLRTNNTVLHDRLLSRDYSKKKIEENLECEIFQTILDEARECYREEIVHELKSESEPDIESNLSRIKLWIENWKKDNNVV